MIINNNTDSDGIPLKDKLFVFGNQLDTANSSEQAKGNIGEDLGQFVRRIDYLLTIDETFNLSTPKKLNQLVSSYNLPWYEPKIYSYSFSEPNQYSKNEALDLLVKTVIRNMQWNTTKKVINASDQTNNDNQNIQQK